MLDNNIEKLDIKSSNRSKFKRLFTPFVLIFITSCVQEVSPINDKENGGKNIVARKQSVQPSYMKGSYITTADNRVVRDLKKENDLEEINEQEANTKDESVEYREEQEIKEYEESYDKPTTKKDRKIKVIKVESGDSMLGIAKKYKMTLSELAELNDKKPPYNIYVGQKLKVYSDDETGENLDKNANKNASKNTARNETNGNYRTVRIKSGDTLNKVAYDNGTTTREIAELNGIKPPYKVYIGQVIKVPLSNKNYYVVEKGDNIYSIAKKNNIPFSDLIFNNNLEKPYKIYVGQKLYLKNSNGVKKNNTGKTVEKVKKDEKVAKNNINNNTAKNVAPVTTSEPANDSGLFIWPVKGEVIKKFGKQTNGEYSDAINIKANQGTNILSAGAGEVAYAGNELKGYGNMIIIKHSNGWLSIYGHCDSMNVKVKDKVSKGQAIATVGKTGNVSEPQLYFAVRKGRIAMDPLKYLNQ